MFEEDTMVQPKESEVKRERGREVGREREREGERDRERERGREREREREISLSLLYYSGLGFISQAKIRRFTLSMIVTSGIR